jgi:hypothetical protein
VTSHETAEARVQSYLARDSTAKLEDVTRGTGLTPSKLFRIQSWKDHEERQLDTYLQQHPEADSGDVQKVFGYSRSKVVSKKAWKSHLERKAAVYSRRRGESRERPLTEAILEWRADESAVDPAEQIDQREQIFRRLLEKSDARLRATLNGLKRVDREALVNHLLENLDGEADEGREAVSTLAILVEVTQSWLEQREQDRRRGERRRGDEDAG